MRKKKRHSHYKSGDEIKDKILRYSYCFTADFLTINLNLDLLPSKYLAVTTRFVFSNNLINQICFSFVLQFSETHTCTHILSKTCLCFQCTLLPCWNRAFSVEWINMHLCSMPSSMQPSLGQAVSECMMQVKTQPPSLSCTINANITGTGTDTGNFVHHCFKPYDKNWWFIKANLIKSWLLVNFRASPGLSVEETKATCQEHM